jgi:hypothetical protein
LSNCVEAACIGSADHCFAYFRGQLLPRAFLAVGSIIEETTNKGGALVLSPMAAWLVPRNIASRAPGGRMQCAWQQ